MDRMKDTIARLADQRARDVRRSRAAARAGATNHDAPDPRSTASRPPAATPPATTPPVSASAAGTPAAPRRVVQRPAAPTPQPPQQTPAQQRQGARPAPTVPALPPTRRLTPPPAIRAARGGERRAATPQPLRPP